MPSGDEIIKLPIAIDPSQGIAALRSIATDADKILVKFKKGIPVNLDLPDTAELKKFNADLGKIGATVKPTVTLNTAPARRELENLERQGTRTFNSLGQRISIDPSGAVAGLRNINDAANAASSSLAKLPTSSNSATFALTNLGRVVQDAPFGFMGIANNLNPLLESFQRLKVESGSNKAALAALGSSLMGPAGLGIAVSIASSLLVVFGDKLMKSSKSADEATATYKKAKEAVDAVFENVGQEAAAIGSLVAVLKNETETRNRKIAALKEIKQLQPDIFNGLKMEGNAVIGLDAAYKQYLESLKTVVAAKIKQAQLEAKVTELLKAQGATRTRSEEQLFQMSKKFVDLVEKENDSLNKRGLGQGENPFVKRIRDDEKKNRESVNRIQDDIEGLLDDLSQLSKGVDVKIDTKNAKQGFDEILSLAKAISKDFEIPFKLQFSDYDTKNEELAKAKKIVDEWSKGNLKLKFKIDLTTDASLLPKMDEQRVVKPVVDAFQEGVNKGLFELKADGAALSQAATSMADDLNLALIEELGPKIAKLKGQLPPIDFNLAPVTNRKNWEEYLNGLKAIRMEAEQIAQVIGNSLSNAFSNMFDAIVEGTNPLKAFLNSIKQAVVDVIKQLIVAAIKAVVLKAILGTSTGGAGGFIGTLFSGGGGGFSSVGRYADAARMMGGQQNVRVMLEPVEFRQSGSDLVGVIRATERSYGRTW